MRQYAVVNDQYDNGMYFYELFDNYCTALGYVLDKIYEFHDSYKDEGDKFEYTEPIVMEGSGGEFIEVTFQSHHWVNEDKERWYILYHDVKFVGGGKSQQFMTG